MFLRHAIELRESIFAPQLVQCAQKRPAKAFQESVSGPVAQAPDPIRAISPAREERRGPPLPVGHQCLAKRQKKQGRPIPPPPPPPRKPVPPPQLPTINPQDRRELAAPPHPP